MEGGASSSVVATKAVTRTAREARRRQAVVTPRGSECSGQGQKANDADDDGAGKRPLHSSLGGWVGAQESVRCECECELLSAAAPSIVCLQ